MPFASLFVKVFFKILLSSEDAIFMPLSAFVFITFWVILLLVDVSSSMPVH